MTLWYVLHQTNSEFRHIQHSVNSDILRYNQAYSALLRDINTYWGIFKAYSCLLRHIQQHVLLLQIHNLANSELWHLELEAYSKLSETLTRHIQNPGIVRTVHLSTVHSYSGMLRTLCKACTSRNLVRSEFWNIQNVSIIGSRCIHRTLQYSWN